MKFQALFFLALIICTTLCVAQGSYGNCCLKHIQGMGTHFKRRVESFRMQETDGDCNIRAVVFTMKKRPGRTNARTVCANPDHPWVQETKKVLEERMLRQN
ncbi:C-C motif chemokine 25b [Stigmatopora argus]